MTYGFPFRKYCDFNPRTSYEVRQCLLTPSEIQGLIIVFREPYLKGVVS